MKRITRNRRLTPDEAARYDAVRAKVAEELPDLIARHHERMAALDELDELLGQLKAAREAKGLRLSDMTERTGMDRSALSKLETGKRANPTVETLVRSGRRQTSGGLPDGRDLVTRAWPPDETKCTPPLNGEFLYRWTQLAELLDGWVSFLVIHRAQIEPSERRQALRGREQPRFPSKGSFRRGHVALLSG